ncbi:MAG: hypothetical protein Q7R94_01955 [bacterium]|nr:hypothetical protein [bacterium]
MSISKKVIDKLFNKMYSGNRKLDPEQKELTVTRKENYHVLINNGFQKFSLETLMRFIRMQSPRPPIWSARLSTGLLGLTNCPAGNEGPKGCGEVLLAIDEAGLRRLIDLGFITCPVCNPEKTEGFWDIVKDIVQRKYDITSLANFADKNILTFDARRIGWEKIMPLLGQWPGRLYVPKDLIARELEELKSRIEKIGCGIPCVGYYNHETPEKFTQYQLD